MTKSEEEIKEAVRKAAKIVNEAKEDLRKLSNTAEASVVEAAALREVLRHLLSK